MKFQNQQQTVDDEQNPKIECFRMSYIKVMLTSIGVLLSGSVLWIIMSWKKKIFMNCTHTKCSLKKAEKVLLVDVYGQEFVSTVQRPLGSVPFFYYKRIKYNWNGSKFVNVRGLQVQRCSELQSMVSGLGSTEAEKRMNIYGRNEINIEVKPVLNLVLGEVRSPFYLYQVFIVLVWCLQLYYQFAVCIALLSIASVSATVWETRKQSKSLRDAMQCESVATTVRDGKETRKPSEELVPGDVMVLSQSHFPMTCDAVLLSGTCVVNESLLTGESTPITKVPIADDPSATFDALNHKKSILFCGTDVLLSTNTTSSGVRAVVLRTGFSTTKGELVKAILFPKPVKLKLYSDLLKCMGIFFILGIPPLIYTTLVGVKIGAYVEDTVLFVLNVITFFVPPALPAVLTSINEQAQRRLRKQGIYCLNSRYINFAGGLDVICFDKTGTLTENDIDIMAVIPAQDKKFESPVEHPEKVSLDLLTKSLATCHSLSKVDDEFLGYDLDIKMFKATGWDMQESTIGVEVPFNFVPQRIVFPKCSDKLRQRVAIVKQFPFESSLKRMSVITQTEGISQFQVFVKGAPELLVSISQTETVPDNTDEVIQFYSSRGYRIIAIGSKSLPVNTGWEQAQKLKRESLEAELQFLGLIILENKLKTETIPALRILNEANIRSVMVTGDNLLTAITVGKKCGIMDELDRVVIMEARMTPDYKLNTGKQQVMQVSYKYAASTVPNREVLHFTGEGMSNDVLVPVEFENRYHIALEGTTFEFLRLHDMDLLRRVLLKGAIFARMSPEHKLYLIEQFQNVGYQVGMCGDGANDCSALKTAHTGVSLSMAEASVAAPFTSKLQNIQCIPALIREGRATLVSTFDSFRYMVCYSFTFLVATLFLFWDGQKPSDGAYVLIDIILNLTPPFLFGATTAFPILSKEKPSRSILSFVPLFSIFSFLIVQVGVHMIAYKYCIGQLWYEPFTFDKENAHSPEASYSGTTILTVNMMAYITGATIFASGAPYRNKFFTNRKYVCVLAVEFLLVTYLSVYPPNFMIVFLNFKRAPILTYHLHLYALTLSVLVFCFFYEKYFVQNFLSRYVLPLVKRRRGPIRLYEKLQNKLYDCDDWPPINPTASSHI